MVAVHGWLLEYPVVYCYVGGAIAGVAQSSCLGGQALSVLCLCARPQISSLQHTPRVHQVMSFSLPACELPAQRPSVARWFGEMQGRFASQIYWLALELYTETRVEEHVVL